MYAFILNMWIMNRLTEAQVDALVVKGRITAEEAVTIKGTAKAL